MDENNSTDNRDSGINPSDIQNDEGVDIQTDKVPANSNAVGTESGNSSATKNIQIDNPIDSPVIMPKSKRKFRKFYIVLATLAIICLLIYGYLTVARIRLQSQAEDYIQLNYPNFKILSYKYTMYQTGLDGDTPANEDVKIVEKTNSKVILDIDYSSGQKYSESDMNGEIFIESIFGKNFSGYSLSVKAKDNLYVVVQKYGEVPIIELCSSPTSSSCNLNSHDQEVIDNDMSLNTKRIITNYYFIGGDYYYLDGNNWLLIQS